MQPIMDLNRQKQAIALNFIYSALLAALVFTSIIDDTTGWDLTLMMKMTCVAIGIVWAVALVYASKPARYRIAMSLPLGMLIVALDTPWLVRLVFVVVLAATLQNAMKEYRRILR